MPGAGGRGARARRACAISPAPSFRARRTPPRSRLGAGDGNRPPHAALGNRPPRLFNVLAPSPSAPPAVAPTPPFLDMCRTRSAFILTHSGGWGGVAGREAGWWRTGGERAQRGARARSHARPRTGRVLDWEVSRRWRGRWVRAVGALGGGGIAAGIQAGRGGLGWGGGPMPCEPLCVMVHCRRRPAGWRPARDHYSQPRASG